MSTCPFAEQKRYDSSYPGRYSGGPNKGIIHTTEGSSLPPYAGGGTAPHFTIIPVISEKRVRYVQHFDTDRPARALANKSGGVQTNGDGAVQIELVGTCAEGGPGLHWPTAPTWALDGLAKLMRWIEADRGIPRRATARPWLAYGKDPRAPGRIPASYGASPARMSQAEWDGFAGWCGHQHVPENTHGDPGSIDIGYLIGHPTSTTTVQEDDMPHNDEDRAAMRKDMHDMVLEVLRKEGVSGAAAAVPEIAALREIVARHVSNDNMTPEQVTEAARTGATEAINARILAAKATLDTDEGQA